MGDLLGGNTQAPPEATSEAVQDEAPEETKETESNMFGETADEDNKAAAQTDEPRYLEL